MQRKIYDSVHGFIRFNDLEKELIDSPFFQRLHYIHQLGVTYLVYPGATHCRFEHSLGVMELATRIYDRITSKNTFTATDIDFCYWRQVIRLAALCHDLGHLPFSHAAEKTLLGNEGHEKWTLDIINSDALKPIFEKLQMQYPDQTVVRDIIKMALGEKKLKTLIQSNDWIFTPWERVLCEVITGDFFGADRIDYLLRDAQCTGVSYGLFDYHQLIEMLCILPSENSSELHLGVEENGIESCEALLLARYFMHKRVYHHSSVKAYTYHLSQFMPQLVSEKMWLKDLHSFLLFTDNEVLSAIRESTDDLHAVLLTQRHLRFKAIELAPEISEMQLSQLIKNLNIPQDGIAWQLEGKPKKTLGLSFPILTQQGSIVPASKKSQIAIPLGSTSWVYVAPEYKGRLLQALESL